MRDKLRIVLLNMCLLALLMLVANFAAGESVDSFGILPGDMVLTSDGYHCRLTLAGSADQGGEIVVGGDDSIQIRQYDFRQIRLPDPVGRTDPRAAAPVAAAGVGHRRAPDLLAEASAAVSAAEQAREQAGIAGEVQIPAVAAQLGLYGVPQLL